ncbi:Eco57I restriction-modification methylase domain-containing protein [Mucilaginibacter sp. P19]|uniref:Eco57I restriction-modification methylase domain-containing protein n=2 Tax=unclassified Mucilaginibacter TaxID=2617802 RepID=UPI003D669970
MKILTRTKPNRGIEPLPNLEFKFVTANSLFMLPDEEYYGGLFNANEDLDSLQQFRLDYLQSYGVEKQKIKENFLHLQTSIFKQQLSFGAKETSRAFKISTWNPFNHEKVDWFDPLWMYGVNTFDIVIGNPPYVNVEKIDTETKKYLFLKYKTCKGRTDLYIAFIERALKLFAKNTGLLTFIIPYPYTNQKYGTDSRKLLIDSYSILEILDTSEYRVFDAAVVKNITLFVGSEVSDTLTKIKKVNSQKNFLENKITESSINQSVFLTLKDYRLETKDVSTVSLLKSVIWNKSISLDNICLISYGARINHKTNGDKKEHYIFKDFKPGLKPFTEGKNIERFSFSQYGWLDYKPNEHYNSMFKELFENEKIMFINIVKDRLRFALDTKHFYNSHTVINCVKWDLLAQANHTTVKRNITPKKIQFGKEFSYKYLIAILNSTLINWYFLNFLSESLHFYPEDAKGLPIHLASAQRQQPFNNLVSYIIFLKALSVPNHVNEYVDNHHLVTMFEEIVDALVYELYFEDEFKNAGVEFFKYAERDFSIIDGLEDDNKMQVIHESYQKLRQKENEIRNNLKLMDTRLNQLIMPIKAAK